MKYEKICCVIVTFNRKELLLRNVLSIFRQSLKVDKIFIIDNHSKESCVKFLENNLDSSNFSLIDYTYLDKNVGGAGGFSYGLKKAYNFGFQWFILMDDDGYPKNDFCFNNLFMHLNDNKFSSYDLVFINSLVEAEKDNSYLSFGLEHIDRVSDAIKSSYNGCIKDIVNPFNGTLVSRGLIDKIGYPNADFFIKGDEVDYLLRSNKANAYIATVVNSEYIHPMVENRKLMNFFGRKMYVYVESPIKEYYSMRNYTYSSLSNFNKKIAKKRYRIFLIKRIICLLLIRCRKFATLKMILKGVKDGKNGKLGIYDKK